MLMLYVQTKMTLYMKQTENGFRSDRSLDPQFRELRGERYREAGNENDETFADLSIMLPRRSLLYHIGILAISSRLLPSVYIYITNGNTSNQYEVSHVQLRTNISLYKSLQIHGYTIARAMPFSLSRPTSNYRLVLSERNNAKWWFTLTLGETGEIDCGAKLAWSAAPQ